MTNAIEQAKREMYDELENVRIRIYPYSLIGCFFSKFESQLEAYLELLRQDHEALHHTARARFEDTRKLEAANQELSAGLSKANENLKQAAIISRDSIASLEFRLAKMTEERDAIQLRLHAVDHAHKTQQGRAGTSGQTSGDRASCDKPDAKTVVVLSAIVNARQILDDYAIYGRKAKKQIERLDNALNGNPSLDAAMLEFEKADGCGKWFISIDKCMHSFFAIGDDQMKCTFCGVGK